MHAKPYSPGMGHLPHPFPFKDQMKALESEGRIIRLKHNMQKCKVSSSMYISRLARGKCGTCIDIYWEGFPSSRGSKGGSSYSLTDPSFGFSRCPLIRFEPSIAWSNAYRLTSSKLRHCRGILKFGWGQSCPFNQLYVSMCTSASHTIFCRNISVQWSGREVIRLVWTWRHLS